MCADWGCCHVPFPTPHWRPCAWSRDGEEVAYQEHVSSTRSPTKYFKCFLDFLLSRTLGGRPCCPISQMSYLVNPHSKEQKLLLTPRHLSWQSQGAERWFCPRSVRSGTKSSPLNPVSLVLDPGLTGGQRGLETLIQGRYLPTTGSESQGRGPGRYLLGAFRVTADTAALSRLTRRSLRPFQPSRVT